MTLRDTENEDMSDVGPERSASDRVARSLREAIARGRFQAGERMYQDEVAAALGVSRQPVRQAFQRLQAEGLLTEARPGRLVVTKMTPDEVIDNISIRLVLEPLAARLAAEKITESQIAELRRYNELVRDDLPNKANWNYEFHKLIAQASGSKLLAQFIDRLWSGMPLSPMSEALLGDTAQKSAHSHDEMIDCFVRRDADGVEALMRDHISLTLAFHVRRNSKRIDYD
ncbi:MAG: transcriptional regulator, GntR family [Caulobacter sp.]|nr:transcriptional regulator, GntR family [Caulobacter sp.]